VARWGIDAGRASAGCDGYEEGFPPDAVRRATILLSAGEPDAVGDAGMKGKKFPGDSS